MPLIPLGPSGHLHADGGVREFLPVQQVMHSPFADRIDVIVVVPLAALDPAPAGADSLASLAGILARTVQVLGHDVGENDLKGAQVVDALLRARQALRAQPGGEELWEEVQAGFHPWVRGFLGGVRRREAFEFLTVQPRRLAFRDSLRFDPAEMAAAARQGREDARAALAAWWARRGHACRPKQASCRD
jgi:hypothetical protein